MRSGNWLLLGLCLLLTACGSNTYAPVSDRSLSNNDQAKPGDYVVRRGDTLYAIAFRYGLDYRQLAKYNGIGENYSIYPGQILTLRNKRKQSVPDKIVRDVSTKAPTPIIVSSTNKVSQKSGSGSSVVSKKAPIKKPSAPPAKNTKPAVNIKTETSSKPRSKPDPVTHSSKNTSVKGPIRWRWPASGKVISTFKTRGKVNKGINIAGSRGSTVKAAARGKVVYAGSGLLGYGNLVIVDHNQQFLSAYAHNSRVLVKENDMVEVGQKIAEMGNTGADRVMLHFEIRRDGKPINPLKYLPKR